MILLNRNALEQRIQNRVDKALEKIKENADNGIAMINSGTEAIESVTSR